MRRSRREAGVFGEDQRVTLQHVKVERWDSQPEISHLESLSGPGKFSGCSAQCLELLPTLVAQGKSSSIRISSSTVMSSQSMLLTSRRKRR